MRMLKITAFFDDSFACNSPAEDVESAGRIDFCPADGTFFIKEHICTGIDFCIACNTVFDDTHGCSGIEDFAIHIIAVAEDISGGILNNNAAVFSFW